MKKMLERELALLKKEEEEYQTKDAKTKQVAKAVEDKLADIRSSKQNVSDTIKATNRSVLKNNY
jgi:hypothetical protein